MVKAVIYARYSCELQREQSIDGQVRECLAFAKSKGYEIINQYIDRAISAKTDDRPSFQQMIRDGTEHKFEAIIVWKVDCFARNRLDALQYKSILRKTHVKVVSATENISDGPEGILLESVLDGLAEYYSADLAQKVKRGMTENVLEGKFNGGLIPYGYKVVDQKYQIDENEAQLIKEIFNLYANTEISANKISKYLTSKGIFNRNGNPFNNGTIYGILGCRKYIGEYSIGDHVNKNGIPAIIDEDTFNRAFQKRATFKKHSSCFRSKVGYALAGKAYCGICGDILIGESSTKRDQTYNYYRCSNYRKKKCELPAVKSVLLEKIVVESTIRFLQDTISVDEMAKTLLEQRFGKNCSSTILQNKILEIQKKMDNIISTIESGQEFDELKKRYEELQDQRITLEAECIKGKRKSFNHIEA